MEPVKLEYLKKSKQINSWIADPEARRMWTIRTPAHPNFRSTYTLPTLRRLGIVPQEAI